MMMRFLRKILTTLSLLLCLAAVALWIACNWNFFYLYYGAGDLTKFPRTDYGIIARTGGLQVEKFANSNLDEGRWIYGRRTLPNTVDFIYRGSAAIREPDKEFLGLGYGRKIYASFLLSGFWPPPPESICDFITLPYWFLTLLFAAAPALATLGAVRRSRRKSRATLCLKCGYDIRASENRCPECGTPIPTPNRTGILPPA